MTDTAGAKDGSATFEACPLPKGPQTDAEAIACDPILLARAKVQFTHASSSRRIAFSKVIEQGNRDGDFGTAEDPLHQIKNRQLLHDMTVQWDSTYMMVNRVLEMRPISPQPNSLTQAFWVGLLAVWINPRIARFGWQSAGSG